MKKISKAEKQIKEFFSNIKNKTPKEIKKIKRLSMKHNLPLKEKRKLFCKKCFAPYSRKEKVRIKKGVKIVVCGECEYVSRFNIKKL